MDEREYRHEYLGTPPPSMEIECGRHGLSPAFANKNGDVFCCKCWENDLKAYEARKRNEGAFLGVDYGYRDKGAVVVLNRYGEVLDTLPYRGTKE